MILSQIFWSIQLVVTLLKVGGRIRAGSFVNQAGTGAPQLTLGAEIPVGYGLTGAGGINVGGAITAASANFTGAVAVGGVLTYDDVTNVDSIGLVTARSGVEFGASGVGGTVTATGNATFTGVVTATSFVDGANLTGLPAGGVEIESGGSSLGAGVTILNFQSGATVTASGADQLLQSLLKQQQQYHQLPMPFTFFCIGTANTIHFHYQQVSLQ